MSTSPLPKAVIVHPLVLLSVVDHYTRAKAKEDEKRVVGVILGEVFKGRIDVTNSYAVPFEEDKKDSSVWLFDHNYHEQMHHMFHKVNAKEKVIGWYSTGPKLRDNDIEIHEVLRRYTTHPILLIIDVNPVDNVEIPTDAYVSVESPPEESSTSRRKFVHISSEIGAYEPEEVGVEHLLREIRDIGGSTVADLVASRINAIKGLHKRLTEMHTYLENVAQGRLPVNPQILYNIQDIFNLSPNLAQRELVNALARNTNDNTLTIYLSSLIRSIIALHELINNKISNQSWEKHELERSTKAPEEEDKEAEKTDNKAS